jgi:hypothetical protein
LPPALLPSVIEPVPKAFAAAELAVIVPARTTVPVVKVLAPERVSPDVVLFCLRPVMLVPITELIRELPEPPPEFVTVPVLLTAAAEMVIPLLVALLLFKIKLPVPVTPPVNVSRVVPLLLVSVVPPAFTVSAPLIFNADVVVFWTMPVMLVPTPAEIVVEPEPVPELVREPVLLMDVPDNVIPAAKVLLLFKIKLPVPVAPPLNVSILVPLLFVSVVPPVLTANAPLSVNAEVVVFSATLVTFEPTPPLIVVVPVPAPVLVIVPVLFTALVANATVPVVELVPIVKLFVPVTPPLKVVEIAAPVLPNVSVPLVPVPNTIAFAKVSPEVVPINHDALVLPLVSPTVTDPVPSALADVVAVSVPALITVPVVKVFTPESVKPEVVLF